MLKPDKDGIIIASGKELSEALSLRDSGKAIELGGWKDENQKPVIKLKLKDFKPEPKPEPIYNKLSKKSKKKIKEVFEDEKN